MQMRVDWSPLDAELAIWRAERLDLPIWWRDDDATGQTPALARLQGLAEKLAMPVHLAVIPKHADASLAAVCASGILIPVVHGWAHENHAPAGAKKAEFCNARKGLEEEAAAGLARLEAIFDEQLCRIFVPPWNRIDAGLTTRLADLGYLGVSTYTPRRDRWAAPGLVQINTHIDPIDWRGGGGLVPAERQIINIVNILRDRRHGNTDRAEPLGLLTHHLVHDAAIWAFSEACLGRLLEGGARPRMIADQRAALP